MAKEFYNHQEIERAAQKMWEESGIYVTDLSDTSRDPYYLLCEFPYPSGDLHTGHWYAFAVTDIFARYQRMQGKNVLFPIGFDAFGLPAENAAIQRGLDPKKWTYDNMDAMRRQLRSMGASFDWSKEVVTCSPDYYKWTQWLFSRLLEHGLAERKEAAVKWCPHDQTVLANEQVVDGKCERCGHAVEERLLTQWFLAISNYAERLLADLEMLPWREEIQDAQRAWIGKSEGAKLLFTIYFEKDEKANEWRDADGNPARLVVFTTRPDTLYGATYLVLAPEHPWITAALDGEHDVLANETEVRAYVEATKAKTERERMENKEKTGVRLQGITAIHPLTKERLPIFTADYVLGSYGTGVVMAVPAHDERDFEFARQFDLPVRQVIDPVTGEEQENPKEKHKIVSVVEHEGKILTIHWPKELGGRLLVGGTAEEGEEPAATAAREIAEETGYTDLELVEIASEQVHHSYFAFSKNQATLAHTTLVHFRLKSEAKEEQKLEADEIGKFSVEWVTPEIAEKEIHDDQHQYALARFVRQSTYSGDGLLRDSGPFSGRNNRDAMEEMISTAGGERTTNYRLRDWLVSRQRYWGCPIPVVYDPEGKAHLVPSEHLPWLLPEDVDFKAPSGTSPLATSKELKERVECIFGKGWTPEYDTLDTFVDSSWYFTRYLAPNDPDQFSNLDAMKHWLPVDQYSGGSEHTTMHLLYSRFFYKALYDMALVPTPEPFYNRNNRGLILGPDGAKMSKSKGNIINPDGFVQKHGADAVRTYLAFIGPYNEPGSYPWKPEGVEAMRRFLDRVYALRTKLNAGAEFTESEQKVLARAAGKMSEDIERLKLNTAVSALMIALNSFEEQQAVSSAGFQSFVRLLAPFAPHLAEHLYAAGETDQPSIHQQPWPTFSESLLVEDTVTIGVQVAGKRRGEVALSPLASEEEALAEALKDPAVQKALLPSGKPSRVVYVPGKILNLIP